VLPYAGEIRQATSPRQSGNPSGLGFNSSYCSTRTTEWDAFRRNDFCRLSLPDRGTALGIEAQDKPAGPFVDDIEGTSSPLKCSQLEQQDRIPRNLFSG